MAQFFEANDIKENKKKVAMLLKSIGDKTYQELKGFVESYSMIDFKLRHVHYASVGQSCSSICVIGRTES
jgi:hypothetical protein